MIPGRIGAWASVIGLVTLAVVGGVLSAFGSHGRTTTHRTTIRASAAAGSAVSAPGSAASVGTGPGPGCPVPAPPAPTIANGTYCGPEPTPGNGYGPQGECTGHESAPPCGPGAVADHYYAYTLPVRCGGQIIFDGRPWDSELPPPFDAPPIYVWMQVNPTATGASFIAPTGEVAFVPDDGRPLPPCAPPSQPPTGPPPPTTTITAAVAGTGEPPTACLAMTPQNPGAPPENQKVLVPSGSTSALLCEYGPSGSSPGLQAERTITDAATLRRLTEEGNAGTVPPPGSAQNCPVDRGQTADVYFVYPGGTLNNPLWVWVDMGGCRPIVDRHGWSENGGLADDLKSLLQS